MNEQQLADIFSEQLDLLLQEQPVDLPAEAAELQELLGFGQQFSQAQFQPSVAAQAAFQSQLATWFTTSTGIPGAATATWLGIPKNLVVIVLVAGGGLGLAALVGLMAFLTGGNSATPTLPTPSPSAPTPDGPPPLPEVLPSASPAGDDSRQNSQQSSDPLPGKAPSNSAGDTINPPKPAAAGDTLPTHPPVISSTAIISPTGTPATTPQVVTNPSPDSNGGGVDPGSDASDGTNNPIEDDRGHGNDPDGYDPDNPGSSTGVGGGQDNAPNLGGGQSGDSSGGNSGDNSSDNNKGKGKDK